MRFLWWIALAKGRSLNAGLGKGDDGCSITVVCVLSVVVFRKMNEALDFLCCEKTRACIPSPSVLVYQSNVNVIHGPDELAFPNGLAWDGFTTSRLHVFPLPTTDQDDPHRPRYALLCPITFVISSHLTEIQRYKDEFLNLAVG